MAFSTALAADSENSHLADHMVTASIRWPIGVGFLVAAQPLLTRFCREPQL